jgi:hypothetical protein
VCEAAVGAVRIAAKFLIPPSTPSNLGWFGWTRFSRALQILVFACSGPVPMCSPRPVCRDCDRHIELDRGALVLDYRPRLHRLHACSANCPPAWAQDRVAVVMGMVESGAGRRDGQGNNKH